MQEWCFKVDGFMSLLPRILAVVNGLDKGKQYVLTIKQKTKRRSLDANAYCWVLLDKLAVELSKNGPAKSPEEIYRETIPLVGGNSKIVPVREDAIDAWKEIWSAGRTGWICEDMGPCANISGYHNIRCFYGSSVYDTKQMARLIDLIVQECQQLDIETATPQEMERMMQEWR